jgi:prepilin peptidase CpaA
MITSPALLPPLAWLLLVYLALHDIGFRTVPDWGSLAIAAIGLALRLRAGDATVGLACGAGTFVLAAACWWRGWLGGGDVKLLGACTVLVPPAAVPGFILAVALAGGALALVYLALAWLVQPRTDVAPGHSALWRRALRAECWRIRRRAPMPYAAAIGIGAALGLLRA